MVAPRFQGNSFFKNKMNGMKKGIQDNDVCKSLKEKNN